MRSPVLHVTKRFNFNENLFPELYCDSVSSFNPLYANDGCTRQKYAYIKWRMTCTHVTEKLPYGANAEVITAVLQTATV